MDQISVLAAGGMQSRMQSLDLVANNLANSSTSGYKTDGEFYTMFTSEAAGEDGSGPSSVPMIQRQWTDFAPGPAGADQQSAGLRDFRQRLLRGARPVRDRFTRATEISASPPAEPWSPAKAIRCCSKTASHSRPTPRSRSRFLATARSRQNGKSIGRIKMVEFQNPAGLTKLGANYFTNTTGQDPVDAAGTQIYQGKIEASNVSASHGAVRIVGLLRQFEMMQKAISLSNDMGKKAIEEVAKV